MSDKSNRIIINLGQTDTQDFDPENLIQAGAQESFKNLIRRFRENTKNVKNDKFERVHNTILINGKRGMGKTSFILSMKNNPNIMEELCPLEIIDPTLIETKEHVLLNIITLIKDEVEEFIKCDKYDDKSTKYKVWKESLRELAGGLSMLDGVGSDHLKDGMWDSAELILEKGLSNAKQGVNLEKNFHKFINKSLEIINKDAFFLILDDIDTSLDKGSAILETLRKYLTSKKLIIAMLGDIDLYSTLVRQLQWEKMDSNKILQQYEFDYNREIYRNQIEHLEEQYLTKVLKPENRINLKNLFELKNEWLILKEYSDLLEEEKNNKLSEESKRKLDDFGKNKKKRLQVELKDKLETQELDKCVIDMIEKIFLTQNSGYTKYYERTLLTQSTRSVLQILQAWIYDKKLDDNFISRIKHTFYTTIKNKLEPYNLLDVPQEEQFLNLLSMYVLKENIGRDNHLKLIPEFSKDDENITMFYLNALSNNTLEPNEYLSYFIKVGYALERYNAFDIQESLEYQKFVDHIALDSGESVSKIAKRLLTTFKIDSNTHNSNPMFFGNLSLSIQNISSIDNGENLSLLISRVYNPKGGSFNFLSFFNLVGLLADVSGKNSDEVQDILTKNNLIREFYLFNNTLSKDDNSESGDDKNDFDISNNLKENLIQWAKKASQIKQLLPLSVLAKIWIRIVYTFNDIQNRSQNKKKNYKQLIELYIAGFLNAVYVEIELHKGNNQNLEMKNPNIEAEYFYRKMKDYDVNEENYTFFDYIYECPIFTKESNLFRSLENIAIQAPKSSFTALNEESQKKAITLIPDWNNKAIGTIRGELNKNGYIDVKDKILTPLIDKMKIEIKQS